MPDFTGRMKEVIEELKSNPPACHHDWRLILPDWPRLQAVWYCTKCKYYERVVLG